MVRLGLLCVVVLSACQSGPARVPVANHSMPAHSTPRTYIAKADDNLFLVSMRYNLDYQDLARRNGVAYPYKLRKGQKVYLTGAAMRSPKKPVVAPRPTVAKPSIAKPAPVTLASAKPQGSEKPAKPKVVAVQADSRSSNALGLTWQWPVRGKVVQTFAQSPVDYQGLDITAAKGTAIKAAANGIVVYAGDDGLVKYGKLVIINHNDLALSAYAHNDSLKVTEGEEVKRGQVIATMGNSGADKVKLHFEIRKEGETIDPQKVLPH